MLQEKKIYFLLTKFGVSTASYGPFDSMYFLPVLVSIFFCSELLARGPRREFLGGDVPLGPWNP